MYGTINPTKPMVPENATHDPTINAVMMMTSFFSFSTLIPRCCASFSPSIMAFKAFPFGIKILNEKTRTTAKIAFFVHVAAARLPIFQNVRSRN